MPTEEDWKPDMADITVGLLSLIFPGLGQLFQDRSGWAFACLALATVCWVMVLTKLLLLVGLLMLPLVHLFSAYEACVNSKHGAQHDPRRVESENVSNRLEGYVSDPRQTSGLPRPLPVETGRFEGPRGRPSPKKAVNS